MLHALAVVLSLALMLSPAHSQGAPPIIGPVLVSRLPLDAALIENVENADGGYTERLLTSDGMANIVLARRTGMVAAGALLAEFYPDAADILEAEQVPIAAHPAARFTFTLGANEDARFGTLVSFSTETDTFAFAVDVWADAFGDYAELIEWWIEALDVFDEAHLTPTGLVLTCDLPEDAHRSINIIAGGPQDGWYIEKYEFNDGMAGVEIVRRTGKVEAQDLLFLRHPDARIVSEEEIALASYPATRLNFSVGENEARLGALVFIPTGTYTFVFVAEAPRDQWNGGYGQNVEIWIESLDIIKR